MNASLAVERLTKRVYWRRRWRILAAARVASGLNTRGTPRLRVARLTATERKAYGLAKFHLRADRRAALGLTARGTPRLMAVGLTVRTSTVGKVRLATVACERMKAEATARALAMAAGIISPRGEAAMATAATARSKRTRR